MKDLIKNSTKLLPEVIKLSAFDFKVEGWPAAVTLVGIAVCGTVMYWIDVNHEEYVMSMNKEAGNNSLTAQEKGMDENNRKEKLLS